MAEYIERKKAISYINSMPRAEEYPETMLVEAVHGALLIVPAADVAPVRHGRWIMRGGKLHCDNCDSLAPLNRGWEDGCTTYEYTASRWCPNCGARMT